MIENPDEGLPLREDMEEALRRSLAAQRSGNVKMVPAEEVANKLGIELKDFYKGLKLSASNQPPPHSS